MAEQKYTVKETRKDGSSTTTDGLSEAGAAAAEAIAWGDDNVQIVTVTPE